MEFDPETKRLFQRYFAGEATDQEIDDLDALLEGSSELRKEFLFEVETDAALREIALEQVGAPESREKRQRRIPLMVAVAVVAIGGLAILGSLFQSFFIDQPIIAELISSEGAAWESDLPTAPGSRFTPGYLKLRSGIATIRFTSGAEVRLEAPAHLVLETPMQGKLLAGSAIIDVPESAIGFVMETPGGYAVDHGTQFAVSVDARNKSSEYEILSGEISVHHENSGAELRLVDKGAVVVDAEGLRSQTAKPGEKGELPKPLSERRLGTEGEELSVIRGSDLEDRVHPDFLMAKRGTVQPEYDRKSFFGFDLSGNIPGDISGAQLRLNLVSCGLGFAARLPEVSTFSIYGLAGGVSESWRDWDSSPNQEEASLLGTFEVPRSQQDGSFVIETKELKQFLAAYAGGKVSFLLVRDTDEVMGNGLVHSFASSSHPEASGPTLTIW